MDAHTVIVEQEQGGRVGKREGGKRVLMRTRPLAGEEPRKRCVIWLVEEVHLLQLARSNGAATLKAAVTIALCSVGKWSGYDDDAGLR